VELKVLSSTLKGFLDTLFLMHRVELKAHSKRASLHTASAVFLMHRVELKE
jgi:hypothetical protein